MQIIFSQIAFIDLTIAASTHFDSVGGCKSVKLVCGFPINTKKKKKMKRTHFIFKI